MPAQPQNARAILCVACNCPAYRVPEWLEGPDDPLLVHYTLYCHYHWNHFPTRPCEDCGNSSLASVDQLTERNKDLIWARLRVTANRDDDDL
jgi:hypothetical protein